MVHRSATSNFSMSTQVTMLELAPFDIDPELMEANMALIIKADPDRLEQALSSGYYMSLEHLNKQLDHNGNLVCSQSAMPHIVEALKKMELVEKMLDSYVPLTTQKVDR